MRWKGFDVGAGLEGSVGGRAWSRDDVVWSVRMENEEDKCTWCLKAVPSIQGSLWSLLCFGLFYQLLLVFWIWAGWHGPPLLRCRTGGLWAACTLGQARGKLIALVLLLAYSVGWVACSISVWVRICQWLCSYHCFFSHKSKANKSSYTNETLWLQYR